MRHLRGSTLLDALLLLAAVAATWQKMSWEAAGRVTLVDLLMAAFVGLFALDRLVRRDARLHPAAMVALGFALLLAAVHLAGYLGLDTNVAMAQWSKGFVKWALFALFLVCGVAHVARRGRELWWRLVGAFVAGVTLSAAYGLVQTTVRTATGVELDRVLLAPLFPGARVLGANLYGVVSSFDQYGVTGRAEVYRLTGFSEDPNHLGVLAAAPLLLVVALIAGARTGWAREHRTLLTAVGTVLFAAIILTQSRSGLLGLGVGVLLLLWWHRGRLFNRHIVIALAILAVLGGAFAAPRTQQLGQLLASRTATDSRSSQAHIEFFQLIVPVMETSPLFGIGINNFALYYQFQTGRADFGPHSFIVATLTEMGLAGAIVWLALLLWVAGRLRALLRVARARAGLAGDDGLVFAAATGLAAGFAATLAGNVFYLTMIFSVFYLLLLLIIAAPAALAGEAAPAESPDPAAAGAAPAR
ncbi:MAG: O-antigen ligase family protein [Gaiellales bacterium]